MVESQNRCLINVQRLYHHTYNYLTPVTSVHTRNIWSATRYALYTCNANLKYFNRSFKCEDARLWNNLDTF